MPLRPGLRSQKFPASQSYVSLENPPKSRTQDGTRGGGRWGSPRLRTPGRPLGWGRGRGRWPGARPTCRRAREIHVRSSSPRRGPWFFWVVFTAMKTSSGRRPGTGARAGGARGPGPGVGAREGARGSGSGSRSRAARAAASARQARHSAPRTRLMRPPTGRQRPRRARAAAPLRGTPPAPRPGSGHPPCPGSGRHAAAGWAKMPLPVQVFNLQVTSRGRRPLPRVPAAGPEPRPRPRPAERPARPPRAPQRPARRRRQARRANALSPRSSQPALCQGRGVQRVRTE